MKSGLVAKKSALSEAIKDLEWEIGKLRKQKTGLKRTLHDVASAIDVDREKVTELQHKVVKLVEREANLIQKKKSLQVRIDKVSERAERISKIRNEMSEV